MRGMEATKCVWLRRRDLTKETCRNERAGISMEYVLAQDREGHHCEILSPGVDRSRAGGYRPMFRALVSQGFNILASATDVSWLANPGQYFSGRAEQDAFVVFLQWRGKLNSVEFSGNRVCQIHDCVYDAEGPALWFVWQAVMDGMFRRHLQQQVKAWEIAQPTTLFTLSRVRGQYQELLHPSRPNKDWFRLREMFRQRRDLGRFVSGALDSSLGKAASGGDVVRPLAVAETVLLCSDLRSFTTLSETYPPPRRSSACSTSRPPQSLVAGLTAGSVVAGILGVPTFRLDLTVIGDPVNLAARLVDLAGKNSTDVVIPGGVREVLVEEALTEALPVRRVKGKTQEIEVFAFLGWGPVSPPLPPRSA